MSKILDQIIAARRSMAILVDPEKIGAERIAAFAKAIPSTMRKLQEKLSIDRFYFFVGGSTMENVDLHEWMVVFKKSTEIPIVIFPGSHDQIVHNADGLLFLNLLSGRNPDYLIGQQLQAAKKLKGTLLEVIPTGYLLLDGGKVTAVERVSKTRPLSQKDITSIVYHAYAGELMGNSLIYLEAGSGALQPVATQIVREVRDLLEIPLIVGGGLRSLDQIEHIFEAGAHMVVVGTAIEENINWKG